MPPFMRCTCSHCGHESYYDGSPDGLGKKVVALTNAPCPECGALGALLTLNAEPPPDIQLWRDGDRQIPGDPRTRAGAPRNE